MNIERAYRFEEFTIFNLFLPLFGHNSPLWAAPKVSDTLLDSQLDLQMMTMLMVNVMKTTWMLPISTSGEGAVKNFQ